MNIKALIVNSFIKTCMTDLDTLNPLSILAYIVTDKRIVYDRYNFLNKYSNIDIYDLKKPPNILDISKDENYMFSDLMDERANNIINKHKGKKIIIFCSGGVDSTGMLISFLKCSKIKNDIIIVTNNSVNNGENQLEGFSNEYPYLYNKLKKDGYKFIENEHTLISDIQNIKSDNDFILLSADCCDQLFGSRFNYYNPQYYEKDWKCSLIEILNNKYNNVNEDWINIYEDWIKNTVNLNIKNFGQFSWFLNFSLKYEIVKWDIPLLYGNDILLHNFINFYDTNKFQLYSLQNFSELHNINPYIQQNSKIYKKVIKEYIYEYTKDKDYLLNKSKQNSNLILDYTNTVNILDGKNNLHILNLKEDLKNFNYKLYFRMNYGVVYDKKR